MVVPSSRYETSLLGEMLLPISSSSVSVERNGRIKQHTSPLYSNQSDTITCIKETYDGYDLKKEEETKIRVILDYAEYRRRSKPLSPRTSLKTTYSKLTSEINCEVDAISHDISSRMDGNITTSNNIYGNKRSTVKILKNNHDQHKVRIDQLRNIHEGMRELDKLLSCDDDTTLNLENSIKHTKNNLEGSPSFLICGSLFSTDLEEPQLFNFKKSNDVCEVTSIDRHMRSINALRLEDSIEQSNKDTLNDSVIEDREFSEKHFKNPSPRVVFHDKIISTVHNIERYDPCDKHKLFYTASEMQNFRLDYIWELQTAREEMRQGKNRNWVMADVLTRIMCGIADFITCHALFENFYSNQEEKDYE